MRRLLWLSLISAAWSLAACGPDSKLEFDWLDPKVGANRIHERSHFGPHEMVGPHARGFQRATEQTPDGRRHRWSRGASSHFLLDLIDARERTLVLDGVPVPIAEALPQTVDVVIDGEWIAQLQWTEAARQELEIPEGFLEPGRNELVLSYGHVVKPAEYLAGSQDQRRLAMAWREVSLLGANPMTQAETEDVRTQRAGSMLVRWTAFDSGFAWSGEGVAHGDGAQLALWIDPGSGSWSEVRRLDIGARSHFRFDEAIDLGEGGVQRCAIAVLRGSVRWERLGSRHDAHSSRPPIVLITLDTTRRDALGAYDAAARTPNLDRLAREGIVFENAYAVAPVTAPSHASMFLSSYPPEHGLTNNGRSLPAARGNYLIAQAKAWGYESAAFVSLGVLNDDLGFAQDFDHFDNQFTQGWWRFASDLNPQALRWIAEHPQSDQSPPGFLWLHYADAHKPYGVKEDVGQGIVLELDGEQLGEIPSMGQMRYWNLDLPAGRSVLTLRSPQVHDDDRRFWYVLRDARVARGGAQFEYGEGWTRDDGYLRMREQAALVFESEQAGPVSLRMAIEELPAAELARSRYTQEVSAVDDAIGELLTALEDAGWLERAIVCVIADHGEDLGENGHFGHVEHVGDTLMRIPWILWTRGMQPRSIDEPVSQIDVAPTLWALAGLPASAEWRGVDALGPIPARAVLLETFPPEADQHWRAMVRGSQKQRAILTEAGWVERHSHGPDAFAGDLTELLAQWEELTQVDIDEIGAEMEERLRSLGYNR